MRAPTRLLLCLSVAVVALSAAAAAAAATPLEGNFVAKPSDAGSIQAGAPRTHAQCSDVGAEADSYSFYARVSELQLAAEPGGLFAVSPSHPLCLGLSSAWAKQPGDALLRRCHSAWFSVSAIAADADAQTPAGLLITIQYADGGYCSTRLDKKEEESSAPSADWKAWVYSIIGVSISSVVSVLGILLLLGQRGRIQTYKEELLALSCGTFIGSIIFSLLPETALEIGLDVKVSAVILGGILFGMMSEGVIHGGLQYLAARVVGETKLQAAEASAAEADPKGDDNVEMTGVSSSPPTSPQALQQALVSTPSQCPPDETDAAPAAAAAAAGVVVVAVRSMEPCPSSNECEHDSASAEQQQLQPSTGEVVGCANRLDGFPSDVTIAHSHAHVTLDHASEEAPHMHMGDKGHADEHAHAHGHRHGHGHGHGHSHARGVMDPKQAAMLNCLADALHNFIDGALIGAVFLASTSAGWTTVITITLHELPQEISDFTLLIAAGLSPAKAALVNFLVSLTAFLGAIIALAVGGEFSMEVLHVMPFSVGLFLYLSLAVLMPEIMAAASTPKRALRIWLAFSVGVGVMAALLALPWGHTHGGGGGEGGHSHDHAGHNH